MHHRRRAALSNGTADGADVGDVADDERTVEGGLPVAGREIVVNHHLMAGLPQGLGGMTADVAGASGDEDDVSVVSGQWSSR